MTACPSCGAETDDGLLCGTDTAALTTMLAAVPALVEQLNVAASKQAKVSTGGKAGKGSAHERSPVNWDAVANRDALVAEADWIRGWPIAEIRRHPMAPEMVSGLGKAVKAAYGAIDRARDRQYLGQCMYEEDGATCHAELWARPGARSVTCSQCEQVHDVDERRVWLLAQAADMLVTVKEASQYVGHIGHVSVSQAAIRGYLHRGRIGYKTGTLIRLGDLLTVLVEAK